MDIGDVWEQFSTKVDNSLSLTVNVVQENTGKVVKFAIALFSAVDHFSPGSLGLLPVSSGFKEADKVIELLGIFKATKEISKVKNASCLQTAQKVMGLAICILSLGAYLEKMGLANSKPICKIVSKVPVLGNVVFVPLSALKMVSLTLSLPDQINKVIEKDNEHYNAKRLVNQRVDHLLQEDQQARVENEKVARLKRNQAVLSLTETVAKIAFIALTLIGTFCSISVLAMASPYMLVGGLALATFSLGNAFYNGSCNNEFNAIEVAQAARAPQAA